MNEQIQQINKYYIQRKIGSGATSTVYLAEDQETKEAVAIKLLHESLSENEDARERFHREIGMLEQLNHPAIVPVLGHGEHNGRLYIIMPVLTGGSVRKQLMDGPLSLAETMRILGQVAPAIDAAHVQGILHRDIKPHNIILDAAGNACLTDFGIARLINRDGHTQTMTLIGTPEFMAPEQVSQGKLTPQTDIYQLGVTLYQMLTGEYPFEGSPIYIMAEQVRQVVPSAVARNPRLPVAVDQVIARAMAKEASERYVTAVHFINDLKAAANGEALTQVVPPLLDMVWPVEENSQQSTGSRESSVVSRQSPVVSNKKRRGGKVAMVMSVLALLMVGAFLLGGRVVAPLLGSLGNDTTPAVVTDEPDAGGAVILVPDEDDEVLSQAESDEAVLTAAEDEAEDEETAVPAAPSTTETDETPTTTTEQDGANAAAANNNNNNNNNDGNNNGDDNDNNNGNGGNGNGNGNGGNRNGNGNGNGNGRPPNNGGQNPPQPPPTP
ncbi:MAG: serine/threonine protein kinase [Chloroflexi bacterium]|nr:serine/threonine protein kinase [Chloroflexota bacterium]